MKIHSTKMKHSRAYIIIGIFVSLLASCGQQHKSQSLVEDFMDENFISPDKVEDVEYLKLDSTKVITDSAIVAMRNSARLSKLFKPSATYASDGVGKKLFRLRVNYKFDGKPASATFYLDEGLNGVVAVKND